MSDFDDIVMHGFSVGAMTTMLLVATILVIPEGMIISAIFNMWYIRRLLKAREKWLSNYKESETG